MSNKKMLVAIIGLVAVLVAAFAFFLMFFGNFGLLGGNNTQSNRSAVLQHMPRQFFTYAEPDFFGRRLGTHQAQLVRVHEERDDGWWLVSADGVTGWAYRFTTTRTLHRPMGAYANRDDETYAALIGPGQVEVLVDDGRWVLVRNRDGAPMWVDLYFMPPFSELIYFFQNLPFEVSVFYKNLDVGFTFGHRDMVMYSSASLNKTPHALYVYHLAENGLTDLSREHVFTESRWRGGTGVIRFMPFGTVFTEYELLIHSVRDSCNVAFHWLVSLYNDHPLTYHEFYRNIGGDVGLARNITGHMMTASEAGLIMYRIFRYTEGDGRYANTFRYSLLNSDVPIIMSDYPVAQKYGRWDGNFHDAAIVYACSPYILVIMSTLDRDGTGAFEEFAEISMFIQYFNNKYFRTN